MKIREKMSGFSVRRAGAIALAAVMVCSLSFPSLAFATVKVDDTELAQGENAVGGGTATLSDSVLNMVGVKAGTLYTDEDLSMNFNGGNAIEDVNVAGSANVEMNFAGENEVEEIHATGSSNVTVNANGHNEFEEMEATDQSSLTINVTGENDFEEIVGRDDANVTIRGTDCQRRDIVNLGEDEKDTEISTVRGTLTIDHVTVNLKAKLATIGAADGNVVIDTSKIAKDGDNEYTLIYAAGTMDIIESVIDIAGTIASVDKMTVEHSDVKVAKADAKYDDGFTYRVMSLDSIDLIREKNGKVEEGQHNGGKAYFVDTDDNDGKDVDLKADGEPAYYRCKSDAQVKAMPKTGDGVNPLWPMAAGVATAATAWFALRRREEQLG